MEIEIREPKSNAEWEAYFQLRYDVLRKPLGQAPGSERNSGDESAIHFALYADKKLVAVARLDEVDEQSAQTRFVAVDPTVQKSGFGLMIMEAVEKRAKADGKTKMILHARDYAAEFYKKIGYKLIGESYKLFDVLQHYLMEKQL